MRKATNPPPLVVAASLVAVQGLVLLVLGVAEIASVNPDRASVAVSTSIFFLAYAAVLLLAALALTRRQSWARGPVLMTQLIQLGLAWSLRDIFLVSAVMVVAALVAIAGMLSRASLEALADDGDPY